jgi:hypothetical protein
VHVLTALVRVDWGERPAVADADRLALQLRGPVEAYLRGHGGV